MSFVLGLVNSIHHTMQLSITYCLLFLRNTAQPFDSLLEFYSHKNAIKNGAIILLIILFKRIYYLLCKPLLCIIFNATCKHKLPTFFLSHGPFLLLFLQISVCQGSRILHAMRCFYNTCVAFTQGGLSRHHQLRWPRLGRRHSRLDGPVQAHWVI